MLELAMIVAAVVAMVRIASADDQSPLIWGLVTFGICVLCLGIPLPLIRVGIALVLSFLAMTLYKVVANR